MASLIYRCNNRKHVDIFAKTIGQSPMQSKQLTADEQNTL
jgi:hypothetical protein